MAMKETAGSMRAYFILVAIASFLTGALPLMSNKLLPPTFMILGIVQTGLCLGMFVCGINIQKYLTSSPGIIRAIIVANVAFIGIECLVLCQYIPADKAGP